MNLPQRLSSFLQLLGMLRIEERPAAHTDRKMEFRDCVKFVNRPTAVARPHPRCELDHDCGASSSIGLGDQPTMPIDVGVRRSSAVGRLVAFDPLLEHVSALVECNEKQARGRGRSTAAPRMPPNRLRRGQRESKLSVPRSRLGDDERAAMGLSDSARDGETEADTILRRRGVAELRGGV